MASNEATEASRLQALNADVRDQDDLERDITRKVRAVPYINLSCLTALTGRQSPRGESRGK